MYLSSDLINFFSIFTSHVLSRRFLSFVPLYNCLCKLKKEEINHICGFGSGSGFMEISTSILMNAKADMFDIKYSPNAKTKSFIDSHSMLSYKVVSIEEIFNEEVSNKYDLNISIQTLEHISNWQSALALICNSVKKPGGYVYIDVPFYNHEKSLLELGSSEVDAEANRQWAKHGHFHCGFMPDTLEKFLINQNFKVIEKGMSAFKSLDMRLHKNFLAQDNILELDQFSIITMFYQFLGCQLFGDTNFYLDIEKNSSFKDKRFSSFYFLAKSYV